MGPDAGDFAGSPGQSFLVARDKLANGLVVGIDLEAKVVANGMTHNLTATSSNPILPTPLFKTSGKNLRSFAGLSWLSARQYAIFFFADHRVRWYKWQDSTKTVSG